MGRVLERNILEIIYKSKIESNRVGAAQIGKRALELVALFPFNDPLSQDPSPNHYLKILLLNFNRNRKLYKTNWGRALATQGLLILGIQFDGTQDVKLGLACFQIKPGVL